MEKRIELDNGRVIILSIVPGLACSTITLQEGFLVNDNLEKSYTLSKWDDYGFNAFSYEDKNELSFDFDINHPLYFPLLHLLNEDELLIIDDDGTAELNKKYLEVKKINDIIQITFVNKLDLESDMDFEKYNVFIKNILYDGRSKIDQQYKDTKERLIKFFDECINVLTEEYHQVTFEEYMVKKKVLKS